MTPFYRGGSLDGKRIRRRNSVKKAEKLLRLLVRPFMITDPRISLDQIGKLLAAEMPDEFAKAAAFGAVCGICSIIEEYLEYNERPQQTYTVERLHRLRAHCAAIFGFDSWGEYSLSEHHQMASECLSQVGSGL